MRPEAAPNTTEFQTERCHARTLPAAHADFPRWPLKYALTHKYSSNTATQPSCRYILEQSLTKKTHRRKRSITPPHSCIASNTAITRSSIRGIDSVITRIIYHKNEFTSCESIFFRSSNGFFAQCSGIQVRGPP